MERQTRVRSLETKEMRAAGGGGGGKAEEGSEEEQPGRERQREGGSVWVGGWMLADARVCSRAKRRKQSALQGSFDQLPSTEYNFGRHISAC